MKTLRQFYEGLDADIERLNRLFDEAEGAGERNRIRNAIIVLEEAKASESYRIFWERHPR